MTTAAWAAPIISSVSPAPAFAASDDSCAGFTFPAMPAVDLEINGVMQAGGSIDADASPDTGRLVVVLTPSISASYTVSHTHRFDTGNTTTADDVAVGSPRVSCG